MVELPRGKLYLAFLVLMLLVAGVIAIYTYIENYISDHRAKKRKVIFKKKRGMVSGYWKTKNGEKYDKDLKIED